MRWTVRVSKDTDVAVRTFLAQRGMKKGDLAKFVEEAVRWRVLDQTLARVKARNAKSQSLRSKQQSMKPWRVAESARHRGRELNRK